MVEKGLPKVGELVVCKITRINPHSATAHLMEYDKEGMIHVSEVASRWVRDIREFVRENQYVVCKVMRVDHYHISLSLKRVHKEEANRKLNEYKRETRCRKLLEMSGKLAGKNERDIEKMQEFLIEEFGSIRKVFDTALKNANLLSRKNIPKDWCDAIVEVAKKNYAEKVFQVRAVLTLVTTKSDGVNVIKKFLHGLEKQGLGVHYIAAPKYLVSLTGKNYKDVEAKLANACENVCKEFKKIGEANFELKD